MIVNSKTTPVNCGTYAGWNKHRKNNETYCDACRSFKLNYDKEYRKNPTKLQRIQERDRLRVRNKEERLRANKRYREVHREECQERSRVFRRKRRALILKNGHSFYTESDVLAKYGTDCYLCQTPIDMAAPRTTKKEGWQLGLHIDHVVPIIAGGPDTLENVRPAHAICNMKKGAKMSFEPELDPDLFDEDDLKSLDDDYDDHAFDEDDLEDLDDPEYNDSDDLDWEDS